MSDCDARIFPLWDSLGKNTGVGCHVLVQEIFQTQGSHPCLLHCTWILNCWATQETVVLQVPYSNSFRQLGGNEELFLSLLGLSVSSSEQSKCRSGTFWGHVFSSPASPTTFISHQNLKKHVSTEKLYFRLQRLSINIIVLFCSYIPPHHPRWLFPQSMMAKRPRGVQLSHSVVSNSVTSWTAECHTSLFITIWSLLKIMSTESLMPFNHLILCCSLLLLPHFSPGSESFQMSQVFASGGQSIGVSTSASVIPMIIQDWFPWRWTSLISLQSKGLSRVFSNTTVQKHQIFTAQLSL